jgi:hypothetical protein
MKYEFPAKLQKMLAGSEADGHERIFSWLRNGISFRIQNHKELITTVLPKYYNRVNVRSFLKQVNLYGFKRETKRTSEVGIQ